MLAKERTSRRPSSSSAAPISIRSTTGTWIVSPLPALLVNLGAKAVLDVEFIHEADELVQEGLDLYMKGETDEAEARYRDVDGAQVATPWQGYFWDYARRDGMLVPLEGEVGWLIDGEYRPYWRGRIEQIDYEYVP